MVNATNLIQKLFDELLGKFYGEAVERFLIAYYSNNQDMDNIDKLDSVMNNEAERKEALMLAADAVCRSLKETCKIQCSMLNTSIEEFMCPRKYIIVPTGLEECFRLAVEKHFDGSVCLYTKDNSFSIDSFLYYNGIPLTNIKGIEKMDRVYDAFIQHNQTGIHLDESNDSLYKIFPMPFVKESWQYVEGHQSKSELANIKFVEELTRKLEKYNLISYDVESNGETVNARVNMYFEMDVPTELADNFQEYLNNTGHTPSDRIIFIKEFLENNGFPISMCPIELRGYNIYKQNLVKLKKKLNLWRFLRVMMCISIVLIPVVIMKTTPKIHGFREEIEQADSKADDLLATAYDQMLPLNSLFTDRDALNLIHDAVPLLSFDDCFSVEKETDMKINYDFDSQISDYESTTDVLSGEYNENPFLFENKIIHTMGTETYHGYKNISWTETYRDSSGKLRTRTRTQTLHATVVKPKPYYNTQVVLSYGSQGGPELSFSRDASHLDKKSERAIERHIKRGEKKLKRLTDKAIRNNDDFTSMSNSEFEVLFDALDRTDEVQYRALFTPLAQTNMVDLILSKTGYGDDFNFFKDRRMNRIISNHSQGRTMNLLHNAYTSYSFDIIKENFINKNIEFFKAVYFDFAPLLAIPAYQERPVHSLNPIPDYDQQYSLKECEALANAVDAQYVVHPNTKTPAILKSRYIGTEHDIDETCITAYSYDILMVSSTS